MKLLCKTRTSYIREIFILAKLTCKQNQMDETRRVSSYEYDMGRDFIGVKYAASF